MGTGIRNESWKHQIISSVNFFFFTYLILKLMFKISQWEACYNWLYAWGQSSLCEITILVINLCLFFYFLFFKCLFKPLLGWNLLECYKSRSSLTLRNTKYLVGLLRDVSTSCNFGSNWMLFFVHQCLGFNQQYFRYHILSEKVRFWLTKWFSGKVIQVSDSVCQKLNLYPILQV